MSFDLVKASLVSIIVESILFGFFTVLFALTSYLLIYKRTIAEPIRTKFFYALSMMYILAIMHIAVNIQFALDGFTTRYSDDAEELAYFYNDHGLLSTFRIVIYLIQSLLGDGIMIYRVCVVCGGGYRVLLPAFILVAGNIACGIGALIVYIATGSVFFSGAKPLRWLYGFFVLTFFINVSGTVLITVRIWLAKRKVAATLHSPEFSPLAVMLFDPGIAYSASLLVLLVLYLSDINAFVSALEWETQIIGIVFSLIIIRIGFRRLWNGRLDYALAYEKSRHFRMPSVVAPRRVDEDGFQPSFVIDLNVDTPKQREDVVSKASQDNGDSNATDVRTARESYGTGL